MAGNLRGGGKDAGQSSRDTGQSSRDTGQSSRSAAADAILPAHATREVTISNQAPELPEKIKQKLIELGAPLPPYASNYLIAKAKIVDLASQNRVRKLIDSDCLEPPGYVEHTGSPNELLKLKYEGFIRLVLQLGGPHIEPDDNNIRVDIGMTKGGTFSGHWFNLPPWRDGKPSKRVRLKRFLEVHVPQYLAAQQQKIDDLRNRSQTAVRTTAVQQGTFQDDTRTQDVRCITPAMHFLAVGRFGHIVALHPLHKQLREVLRILSVSEASVPSTQVNSSISTMASNMEAKYRGLSDKLCKVEREMLEDRFSVVYTGNSGAGKTLMQDCQMGACEVSAETYISSNLDHKDAPPLHCVLDAFLTLSKRRPHDSWTDNDADVESKLVRLREEALELSLPECKVRTLKESEEARMPSLMADTLRNGTAPGTIDAQTSHLFRVGGSDHATLYPCKRRYDRRFAELDVILTKEECQVHVIEFAKQLKALMERKKDEPQAERKKDEFQASESNVKHLACVTIQCHCGRQ